MAARNVAARPEVCRALIACITVVLALSLRSQPVHAALASPSYQDVYTSSAPTGYSTAPVQTTVGSGVLYEFSVWNPTTSTPPRLRATVYAQRVTAVNGVDVSTGFPAVIEQDLFSASVATDPPTVIATIDHDPVPLGWPGLPIAVHTSAAKCGYLVVWAGSTNQFADPSLLLNAGVIRVTGCPPPPPTPFAAQRVPPPPRVSGLSPYEGGFRPRDPSALLPTPGAVVEKGIRGEGPVIAATVVLAGVPLILSWARRRPAGPQRSGPR